MFSKTINGQLLLLALVLLTASVCSVGQGREPKGPTQVIAPQESVNAKKKKDEQRIKLAQGLTQNIQMESKFVLDPVVRLRIRMLVADAYWNFQPEKAREIMSEDFAMIPSIAAPRNESDFGAVWSRQDGRNAPMYKGRPIDLVKAQLRREMLAIACAHDSAFARGLVAAKPEENTSDEHAEEIDEVLATASNLADTDPEAAARIIRESLDNSVNEGLVFQLIRLRATSPVEASAIFNQVFTRVKATGDLWAFQRLVPYILPTELDRLIGGKHYLTDTQRMKDASMVIDYAAELLYRRIQSEVPSNMAPELGRREYYMWRNLLAAFNDLKPESAWLVNSRLRQLTAVLPQASQGATQGPWSEDKLGQLVAAADESVGEKRDGYLTSAAFNAWRGGQGDLEHAISLAEKVDSAEQKNLTLGTIYFQAGVKTLRSEGPDHALSLARKIEMPGFRVRLYLNIISALNSVKALERTEILRDELLNWLRNREKNSDTAWAVLDYLDGSVKDKAEQNFIALEILVRVLNSPNLHSDLRASNRIYWYPEFHDFRKSLAPLASADFDRGLEILQMLSNREMAMQIHAAFYGDYLKTHKPNRTPLTKLVSKSMN